MTADEWNAKHEDGEQMIYYMRRSDVARNIAGKRVELRGPAWTLGGGQVIVRVTGVSGGVSIEHLAPMPA